MARRPSSAIHSRSRRSCGSSGVPGVQLLLGEQARLDPLGQLHLLLGVEQGDLADLLEVVLDRVGGGTGDRHLLLRLVLDVGVGDLEGLGLGRLDGRLGRHVLLDLLEVVLELGLQLGLEDGGSGQLRCGFLRAQRVDVQVLRGDLFDVAEVGIGLGVHSTGEGLDLVVALGDGTLGTRSLAGRLGAADG